MRVLGLDYGEKTIGVAISDELLLTAQGIEIIRRENEEAIKKSVARIGFLIKEYNVTSIILGFPKNMNNTEGDRCIKTRLFKERLERNFKRIDIVLWDERMSTIAAERSLLEADLSRKKREDVIDKMAAVFILQGYLNSIKNKI